MNLVPTVPWFSVILIEAIVPLCVPFSLSIVINFVEGAKNKNEDLAHERRKSMH